MKKLSILGCFTAISIVLALPVFLSAQETRREIAPQATTEDARPNNDQIPDVYAIHGQVQRVVLFRFKYKADLLPGLQKMIKQEKIRNAVILSGVGSVRSYQLHDVANGDFPTKDVVLKNPNGPANIVGMSGVVINGKVHAHIALANADKAFGGDLEANTTVLTFAAVTLGVLDDAVDLNHVDDRNYR